LQKYIKGCLKLLSGLLIAVLFWILFVFLQQVNYRDPEQIYLMGTPVAYGFVFFFLCISVGFIFSFFKNRFQPAKLKRRFFVFAFFYLVSSPLVILSFDNYLLVTPQGLGYSRFFSIEDMHFYRWQDINHVVLDYKPEQLPFMKEKLRLQYHIHFKDGTAYNLNSYNSPLYDASQFKAIHRTLLRKQVPVIIERPLPADVSPDSFIYQMFHFHSQ
jgi:hypothetical protein